jgi:hypothetical protein
MTPVLPPRKISFLSAFAPVSRSVVEESRSQLSVTCCNSGMAIDIPEDGNADIAKEVGLILNDVWRENKASTEYFRLSGRKSKCNVVVLWLEKWKEEKRANAYLQGWLRNPAIMIGQGDLPQTSGTHGSTGSKFRGK